MDTKIFLDTNVVFDFLSKRSPFYDAALKIMELAHKNKINVCCFSITYVTLSYLLHRDKMAKNEIDYKLKVLNVICPATLVNDSIVKKALLSDFVDFEDALQYYSAIESEVDLIITRNNKDFPLSDIAVMTPDEFLN
ncbi:MAG: PIN domain-containing protein [Bacteroidales bacterium]|nr:PIN domain-containing protein [Bacteroidales bacterium]